MNQTFNFQRFLLMTRLEIAEKGRNQLMMAGLMLGLLVAMMLPIIFVNKYSSFLSGLHIIAFVLLVIFGLSLYTNQVFNNYAAPSSGMAAIMVPASRFEKWLSALLLNLLFVVPFVYLSILLHQWTATFANENLLPGESKYEVIPTIVFGWYIVVLLFFQSASFLGSIYFVKASYIKTVGTVLVLGFVAFLGNQGLANLFTPAGYEPTTNLFGNWHMTNFKTGNYYKVNFPAGVQLLVHLVPFLLILALWYTAYFRLKEKEI